MLINIKTKMNQNEVLIQHLENISLEELLEDSNIIVSQIFDDENRIKELFQILMH